MKDKTEIKHLILDIDQNMEICKNMQVKLFYKDEELPVNEKEYQVGVKKLSLIMVYNKEKSLPIVKELYADYLNNPAEESNLSESDFQRLKKAVCKSLEKTGLSFKHK